ncbi:MAG: M15 family metallopeptidase [Bacilli bacterium]|nr:M15 family metallopeptidase [Bacilli bacterium]
MDKAFKISYYIMIATMIIFLLFMINTELNDYYNSKEYDELVLINEDSPLVSSFKPLLKEYKGFYISKKVYESLVDMSKSAGRDGILLEIDKAYTSYIDEKTLYNDTIIDLISQGYSSEDAITSVDETMSKADYSEFTTGLAIRFSKQNEDEEGEMLTWLENNAYKYGFVLRYPEDKEDITNVSYRKNQYRYVGVSAANEMYDQNLCLEEYLNLKG